MDKYAIKTDVYATSATNRRVRRTFDGPWADTPEDAVRVYKAALLRKALLRPTISTAFLAVKADEATAGSKDGKGVCYNPSDKIKDVKGALKDAGLEILGS